MCQKRQSVLLLCLASAFVGCGHASDSVTISELVETPNSFRGSEVTIEGCLYSSRARSLLKDCDDLRFELSFEFSNNAEQSERATRMMTAAYSSWSPELGLKPAAKVKLFGHIVDDARGAGIHLIVDEVVEVNAIPSK